MSIEKLPYILVLDNEKSGAVLYRAPIKLKDGTYPAFDTVNDAVEAAGRLIGKINFDRRQLPVKMFDKLEIQVCWGHQDEAGISAGTQFASVDSVYGRLQD